MFASIAETKSTITPTVGDLRKALDGVPDDIPIVVEFGTACVCLGHGSDSHYATSDEDQCVNCVIIEEANLD